MVRGKVEGGGWRVDGQWDNQCIERTTSGQSKI